MNQAPVFKITYWGVAGTFSAPLRPRQVTDKVAESIRVLAEKGSLALLRPGEDLDTKIRELMARELPFHLRSSFGGNTTCIEVETPDALIILDSGSGFRELGLALASRWDTEGSAANRRAHVLLSHGHMDHTFATPYFDPYYDPANSFTLWAAQATLDSLTSVLNPHSPMSHVFFPPTLDQMTGLREFKPLEPGVEFQIGGTRITTCALHHPGGSMGFRLENSGRTFVFATDHEQQTVPDLALCRFAAEADLLYTEGQYSQEEYDGCERVGTSPALSRRGWGHTPLPACVQTALAARVRRLHIGHRDPGRDDRAIALFEQKLQRLVRDELRRLERPSCGCEAAIPYEGMTIEL